MKLFDENIDKKADKFIKDTRKADHNIDITMKAISKSIEIVPNLPPEESLKLLPVIAKRLEKVLDLENSIIQRSHHLLTINKKSETKMRPEKFIGIQDLLEKEQELLNFNIQLIKNFMDNINNSELLKSESLKFRIIGKKLEIFKMRLNMILNEYKSNE